MVPRSPRPSPAALVERPPLDGQRRADPRAGASPRPDSVVVASGSAPEHRCGVCGVFRRRRRAEAVSARPQRVRARRDRNRDNRVSDASPASRAAPGCHGTGARAGPLLFSYVEFSTVHFSTVHPQLRGHAQLRPAGEPVTGPGVCVGIRPAAGTPLRPRSLRRAGTAVRATVVRTAAVRTAAVRTR